MGNKVRLSSYYQPEDSLVFECPGCGDTHVVIVKPKPPELKHDPGDVHPVWGWNGNLEKPTFSPSLLVRAGHYAPGQTGPECWCTYNAKHPDDPAPCTCYVCHSFVRDGKIEFLSDCTHLLAGQTVDLVEIEVSNGN